MLKKINSKKYEVCCSGNCPTVFLGGDGLIHITDDHGKEIKMSLEEALFLSEAAKKIGDDA